MARTRIQIARPDIIRFFEEAPKRVFRHQDITAVLTQNRAFWRLTLGLTTSEFLDYLLSSTKLRKVSFPFSKRGEIVYVWGDVPYLEVLLDLKAGSYLSHYGAVRIHGLTEQIPKALYVNTEQPQLVTNSVLTQRSIDYAFRQSPRLTNNVAVVGDYRIYQVHGKASNNLGVVTETVSDIVSSGMATVRVTSIERTLIDITVRPMYAGGVFEVRKAYAMAADRISVNRLSAMLRQLAFTYPYYQAVGFYLESSGAYRSSQIDIFRKMPQNFDFYLTYRIDPRQYIKKWRLFVPEGF